MESGRACVTADARRRTAAKGVEEEASSRENHFELREAIPSTTYASIEDRSLAIVRCRLTYYTEASRVYTGA